MTLNEWLREPVFKRSEEPKPQREPELEAKPSLVERIPDEVKLLAALPLAAPWGIYQIAKEVSDEQREGRSTNWLEGWHPIALMVAGAFCLACPPIPLAVGGIWLLSHVIGLFRRD